MFRVYGLGWQGSEVDGSWPTPKGPCTQYLSTLDLGNSNYRFWVSI